MSGIKGAEVEPEAFRRACAELAAATWRPEFTIDDMPAPQRIAPFAIAISADVTDAEDNDIANGRLILLHDPAGSEAWDGTFRLVTFARAEIDAEMVADPLLNPVGWSWLTEPLETREVPFSNPSGTVTSVSSQSFGQLGDEDPRAEMEIRASWTPLLEADGSGLSAHVQAWQDLLATMAGLPPVPDGVVMLSGRRRSAR
ncbi:DUF3000 domain-containing protein [Naumannella halotolerans]|uniref:DUF3000 domain-containing protein n=1 Tax=Naumannella halotolerans TaxID=993414 RepID=UPI00105B9902|nr:DUF3000 domain-containing protein [Naumannella halotolerans]